MAFTAVEASMPFSNMTHLCRNGFQERNVMTHVTDEELGKISRQWNDLFRRVRDGSLDVYMVSEGLQGVIEGRYPHGMRIASAHQEYEGEQVSSATLAWLQTPKWWRTPEQQLARARELWPDTDLPEPPSEFGLGKTEVLLLHVPRSFEELWGVIEESTLYIKRRSDDGGFYERHLQLAPNVPNRTEPVWLAFDYAANRGEMPINLWDRSDLAASEILSAVIQFPDWLADFADRGGSPYLNLSGYQLERENRLHVPFLCLWRGARTLELGDRLTSAHGSDWLSPTVREC